MISSPSISDEYNLSHVHSNVIEGMFLHDGHNLSKSSMKSRAHSSAISCWLSNPLFDHCQNIPRRRRARRATRKKSKLLPFCHASRRFLPHYHNLTMQQGKKSHISQWCLDVTQISRLLSRHLSSEYSQFTCFALYSSNSPGNDILYWTLGDSLAHVMFVIFFYYFHF